jgi:hypothetical protein
LDDLFQGLALADVGQGDGEAAALADDVDRGIGMEVAGAVLGLGAVDFVGIVQVVAVVGDQVEA